ncbi:site-specific integrase [Frateuria sp. MAH-13]|uniref:Site-specific integrase n=1 Tax=Frateuria flava TaxID=2821489 RepID=A0ABS4DQU8_9GAMM|nr:site-specific integrase [Frateuria flava]MBP1475436.1 site-specific integrase [Frateuria flava]
MKINCVNSARPLGAMEATSKDGYVFNVAESHWELSKDVTVSLGFANSLSRKAEQGFRSTLKRYAEEMSARHVRNMANCFKRFVRDTDAAEVSVEKLLDWRAKLGQKEDFLLGALKGFLLAWSEYGYGGISDEAVTLLLSMRIKGNEKGAAVMGGCPNNGPLTDLEMASLLSWANSSVVRREICLEEYAYLFCVMMTARRAVQISALRGADLRMEARGGVTMYSLNVPRAKQRGVGFRGSFRKLAIVEDLYLVLGRLHHQFCAMVEEAIGSNLEQSLREQLPIFANAARLKSCRSKDDLRRLLNGPRQDVLHAPVLHLNGILERLARLSTARSERTGECIRITASRFRRTRGTKLRREGFSAFVIAELLDHSDVQNVRVYTENTAQEAVVINELIGKQLAPFAQACMGRLVRSEREAIRGANPRSRVPNDRQHAVGTCGNFGFCASGFRACYTCRHFQPWVDGPHQEVLADLYAEKQRARDAGCADLVINANDQLILAVEHCVQLCNEAKAVNNTQLLGVAGG